MSDPYAPDQNGFSHLHYAIVTGENAALLMVRNEKTSHSFIAAPHGLYPSRATVYFLCCDWPLRARLLFYPGASLQVSNRLDLSVSLVFQLLSADTKATIGEPPPKKAMVRGGDTAGHPLLILIIQSLIIACIVHLVLSCRRASSILFAKHSFSPGNRDSHFDDTPGCARGEESGAHDG